MTAAKRTSWTVLVVDDEPDIRYLLRVTLESAGYRVVEAAHGEAALESARRSAPQLVVTDQMMPVMNGGELIERLRAGARTKAIPIVMVSGTRGVQTDADALLGKPFDPTELIALVDRLTGKEQ